MKTNGNLLDDDFAMMKMKTTQKIKGHSFSEALVEQGWKCHLWENFDKLKRLLRVNQELVILRMALLSLTTLSI